jgi:SAM-dependent methyltransferase
MHDTAYEIGGLVMSTYLPLRAGRILEIGAPPADGGLRDQAPRNADYVGIAFEAGTGVDHVVSRVEDWPVADDSFDLVMAPAAFEHDPAFWQTFLAMCRKTRPGGYLYLGARANGAIRRQPRDCWRFYPDAGLALQDWAQQHGIGAMLVESFVAECEDDHGDTFCAVFRREPGDQDIVRRGVHEQVACTNVVSWRTREVIRPQDVSGRESLAQRERDIVQSERALQAQMALYEAQIAELSRQLDEWEARASFAQSNLRQREEENHQYRQQIDALKSDLQGTERLGEKLAEADAWVFRLAAERAGHQARIRQLEAQVAGLSDKLAQLHGALQREAEQRQQSPHALRDHPSDTTRLEHQLADLREKLRHEHDRAARAEGQVRRHEQQLSERFGESAKLTQQILDSEQDMVRLREELASQGERAKTLETQNRALQDNLRQRFSEITRLTEMILDRDHKLEELDWLRQVFAKLARRPFWWFLMPVKWRQKREHRRLKNANLFDAETYVKHYPDVAGEPIDPLLHYILHGMGEARNKYT